MDKEKLREKLGEVVENLIEMADYEDMPAGCHPSAKIHIRDTGQTYVLHLQPIEEELEVAN